MTKAKYSIGIDLGTTNCTIAYSPLDEKSNSITLLPIPQIVQGGIQDEKFSLPSFIYFLLTEEIDNQQNPLSWDPKRSFAVGTYARDRGAEMPTRVIASAKSWLCHSSIDRREKILPIEAEDASIKMSPLEACSALLSHLKETWEYHMPQHPFGEQQILITVPASFDPSARQLVQEASARANYPEIVLLEEPQAAFYAWLQSHEDTWRKQVKVGETILVVDIGGGTTDFSLIEVEEEQGNLSLRRKAVGSHLLLGGDNIDLALAYLAKGKLEEQGHEISSWQLQSLIHQCRKAKEELMGENPPKHVEITLLGRGSKLIGNTLKTKITEKEVCSLILDGFIPLVDMEERSQVEKRSGIQQIGLPFVSDPRISCQLAQFLSLSGEFILPSAVLFNGGTMKAAALRDRLMKLLNQWAKQQKKPEIRELLEADYDYAVSRGAAYYGQARQGKAIRIRGGTSRSYFVGVEEAVPAVPGVSPPLSAICIVPFGMEEGEEKELKEQEFALVLGEQATFRFFSHGTEKLGNGIEPAIGTVVRNWKELEELHPIETLLEKGEGEGKTVRVKLKSRITELGFLELWCMGEQDKRWKLEFDIRSKK